MKKIISTVLICAIFCGMFSACSKDTEIAEKTVHSYWQCVTGGNFDTLSKLSVDDADGTLRKPFEYLEEYSKGIIMSLSGILEEEKIKSVSENGIKTLLNDIDYTIETVASDGDEVTVRVTASMPDLDIDLSSGEALLFKTAGVQDMRGLLDEFLKSKGIDLENAAEAYAESQNLLEKDFMQWIIDTYLQSFLDELLSEVKKTRKIWDFTLEEENGNWLIEKITEI